MPLTTQPKTAKKATKKPAKPTFKCDYCTRAFVHETSLLKHVCEQKRRHLCKDDKVVRMAFFFFQKIWKSNLRNRRREITYSEFASSKLYKAIVSFSKYINDLNVIRPEEFVDFLMKAEVEIDRWQSPVVYQRYVRELTKKETPSAALERNFLLMQQWAQDNDEEWTDFFRKVSPNQATLWMIAGRISPWVFYLAPSAAMLLERLSGEQIEMVKSAIDPKFWAIKIAANAKEVEIIKKELELAGL